MGAMAVAWLTVASVAAPTVMSAAVVTVSIVVTAMTTTTAMHDGHTVIAIDWTTVAIVGCDDPALVDGASA
jgi:hypothetical protein